MDGYVAENVMVLFLKNIGDTINDNHFIYYTNFVSTQTSFCVARGINGELHKLGKKYLSDQKSKSLQSSKSIRSQII